MHLNSDIVRYALLILAISMAAGPIFLWRDYRYRTRVDALPTPADALPANVVEYMTPHVDALAQLGFALVGYFDVSGTSTGAASFLALTVNRATSEMATALFVTAPSFERGFLEFVAMSSEEQRVDTNTNGAPTPLFPPAHPIFRFPQVDDVPTLYRLHRDAVAETLGTRALKLPAAGDEASELTRRLQSYAAYQQRRGNMRDAGNDVARLTLKGALIMSWRGLWPVALRRRMRIYRDAEKRIS